MKQDRKFTNCEGFVEASKDGTRVRLLKSGVYRISVRLECPKDKKPRLFALAAGATTEDAKYATDANRVDDVESFVDEGIHAAQHSAIFNLDAGTDLTVQYLNDLPFTAPSGISSKGRFSNDLQIVRLANYLETAARGPRAFVKVVATPRRPRGVRPRNDAAPGGRPRNDAAAPGGFVRGTTPRRPGVRPRNDAAAPGGSSAERRRGAGGSSAERRRDSGDRPRNDAAAPRVSSAEGGPGLRGGPFENAGRLSFAAPAESPPVFRADAVLGEPERPLEGSP